MTNMTCFRTEGYQCNALEFSPFKADLFAVAGGRNFGLSGNGILQIVTTSDPVPHEIWRVEWKDTLFDITWSEHNPNVLVSSSGDGSLQLWDLSTTQRLLQVFKEHGKEVSSVEWNVDRGEPSFISASWDNTIKLWNPERKESLQTFRVHSNFVYNVRWSPLMPGVFLSTSADGTIGLFDIKAKDKPFQTFLGRTEEVLSCDWTKYDKNVFVTAGLDSLIRSWDLRNIDQPVATLAGHGYPVKRLKCSPHHQFFIASVSYDFTTRFWDFRTGGRPLHCLKNHTEFTTGVDFNLHKEGEVADCSWDGTVNIFRI